MTAPREFRCPECGYDGFKVWKPTVSGFSDVQMSWFCPSCKTLHDRYIELVETTDPRAVA